MELVYLWVEEYKNIHKQGFNFSPRFECSYENDALTICDKKEKNNNCKNKNYIENFFGENINITAIVGKNGSGKSSIQKLIFILLFFKKFENQYVNQPTKMRFSLINLINSLINKNIFLIINQGNELKKISLLHSINQICSDKNIKKFLDVFPTNLNAKTCPLEGQYEELKNKDINFFLTHFNYMIDTWYDGIQDDWIKNIYHRSDGYNIPLLLEPYKGHHEQIINIDNMEYLNNQKIYKFISKITGVEEITKFFNPKEMLLSLNSKKLQSKYESIIIDLQINQESHVIKMTKDQINNLCKEKKLSEINKLYIALKVLSSNKTLFRNQNIQEELKKLFQKSRYKSPYNTIEQLIDYDFSNLLKSVGTYATEKLESCIDVYNSSSYDFDYLKDSLQKKVQVVDFSHHFKSIPPWIDVQFFYQDKKYSALSSGEKIFFMFVVNVLYQIQNVESDGKYESINLFLDEVEFGLHPDWQKRFLNELLDALKSFKIKINIFFATHSPFILSDLPKENVIFLENGKQVYPNIDTFGANIHTLLSHGFFMKDGLMGEFAKEKINEAIKYLNQKSLTEKEIDFCENIIAIIGEPILKRQLQKMLDSKRLNKMDEIEKIKEEIKRLEQRMTLIWKNSQ